MNSKLAITIRAKKLGILLKDSRATAGKTKKECAEALGLSIGTINSFEDGRKSPSLPELELLAFFLDIPLSHYWSDVILSAAQERPDDFEIENTLALRNQRIGTTLRDARKLAELTYAEILDQTGISPKRMRKFERGQSGIPLPELEILCTLLEIPMKAFNDGESDVGRWVLEQNAVKEFIKLPLETQEFVTQAVNQHYIDIAKRLSRMTTEELRGLAETLLEITV